MEGFGYILSLDTTSGSTLYDDLTETIIVPRLFNDGRPVKIKTFKWYVDGAYFSDELYLSVETEDIVEGSNIYTLEVMIDGEDEEITVEDSIEIIYLEGVNQSDPIDDDNSDDRDPINDPDYNDPRDWNIDGKTFVKAEDYKNSDYSNMFRRIKNGDDKQIVFSEQHQEVAKRVIDSELIVKRRTIPYVDLYTRIDQVLMRAYDDIYE